MRVVYDSINQNRFLHILYIAEIAKEHFEQGGETNKALRESIDYYYLIGYFMYIIVMPLSINL